MEKLDGKQILFFSATFFGYEKAIKKKMEELGASVDMYDDRSVSKSYEKALLKITPKLFIRRTRKYYRNILKSFNGKKYDFILFVNCEMADETILTLIRKCCPRSRLILYLDDSIENVKGIKNKFCFFDRVLSFDRIDCLRYTEIQFRPLFYLDEYKKNVIREDNYPDFIYDMCFIGTIHSDRYAVLSKIVNKQKKARVYLYPYLQARFMYYFYKLTKKEFRKTKIGNFKFKKLSAQDIAKIVNNSAAVIDIQHPKQTGLTMRTIEMLGMKKKIVTTNQDIKNYDLYSEENICVIDRNNPIIDWEFINIPYKDLPSEVYEKYSLQCWIYDVLGV